MREPDLNPRTPTVPLSSLDRSVDHHRTFASRAVADEANYARTTIGNRAFGPETAARDLADSAHVVSGSVNCV